MPHSGHLLSLGFQIAASSKPAQLIAALSLLCRTLDVSRTAVPEHQVFRPGPGWQFAGGRRNWLRFVVGDRGSRASFRRVGAQAAGPPIPGLQPGCGGPCWHGHFRDFGSSVRLRAFRPDGSTRRARYPGGEGGSGCVMWSFDWRVVVNAVAGEMRPRVRRRRPLPIGGLVRPEVRLGVFKAVKRWRPIFGHRTSEADNWLALPLNRIKDLKSEAQLL